MRLRILVPIVSLLAVVPLLAACDDDGLLQDAVISADSADLGLPGSASRGSALDLVRTSANATLVRRPERLADAQQWDVAVRRTPSGAFVLRQYDAEGTGVRGAGIAVTTQSFDAIEEAPRSLAAYTFNGDVPLSANGVYFFRSRQFGGGIGLVCVKYAKARVVALDPAAGEVRLALVINENCDDERLSD